MGKQNTKQKTWLFSKELKLLTLLALVDETQEKSIYALEPLLMECKEELKLQLDKLNKNYMKTLNEHDKAVIADYNAIQFKLFKKRNNKK